MQSNKDTLAAVRRGATVELIMNMMISARAKMREEFLALPWPQKVAIVRWLRGRDWSDITDLSRVSFGCVVLRYAHWDDDLHHRTIDVASFAADGTVNRNWPFSSRATA